MGLLSGNGTGWVCCLGMGQGGMVGVGKQHTTGSCCICDLMSIVVITSHYIILPGIQCTVYDNPRMLA